MKYTSLAKKASFAFLTLMLCCSTLVQAKDVKWEDFFVENVIDENLLIKGKVELPQGATIIKAETTDVKVTLEKNPTVFGWESGSSRLVLDASAGRKITFCLENDDLTFRGSRDTKKPLLILVTGDGDVEFLLKGGKKLEFTSDNSGGTQVFRLAGGGEENTPILLFDRADVAEKDKSKDVEIIIGKESLLSYIAPCVLEAQEKGVIRFDPSNTGSGRMVLEIENTGAVVVANHKVANKEAKKISGGDIDRTTAVFESAVFEVVNGNIVKANIGALNAGLLVLNKNKKQSDLLWDPFLNLGAREDNIDYKGSFDGVRYGFVIGQNGELRIGDNAFFDYVGLWGNVCPNVSSVFGLEGIDAKRILKERNPSALIIDGSHNPQATPAKIDLGNCSAIFFRSGADDDNDVVAFNKPFPFTIDPINRTDGAGNIVFDVEAPLNVQGQNTDEEQRSKIELLSLFVEPTGGSLFIGDGKTNFPLRTFARDNDLELRQYNNAAFFFNSRMNIFNASLSHTDENHMVFENNDTRSEPTYIGGEVATILDGSNRPTIAFYNSRFNVHTDVALTGVDLLTPNAVVPDSDLCADNDSQFVFYSDGLGRVEPAGQVMILGTQVGSLACDGCTVVSSDAHLDVMQDQSCSTGDSVIHRLRLTTALNDHTIIEDIPESGIECGASALHSIFLGHSSNISIGTHQELDPDFETDTHPTLSIAGNFFTFETRGGPLRSVKTVAVVGKGGIFVDENGLFTIEPEFQANIATMVVRSGNGVINLPAGQVTFENMAGITEWRLDLSDPEQQVIVEQGETLSNFILDLATVRPDFDSGFCPIDFGSTGTNLCPTVETNNITPLITVRGTLDQLEIRGSRLGDPAYILVDGGQINEIIFQDTQRAGEVASAVIVIQNDGIVTLNNAGSAQTTLGINGIVIVANGSGRIDLADDTIISSRCSILRGPDFLDTDVLEINALSQEVLRVGSQGIFDLQSFGNAGTLRLSGNLQFVLDPGAILLMGTQQGTQGPTLEIADNAAIIANPSESARAFFNSIPLGPEDPLLDPLTPTPSSQPHNPFAPLTGHGAGVANTDSFRVKMVGIGTISFTGNGSFVIDRNAFVGVETLANSFIEVPTTQLTFEMNDSSQFTLGNGNTPEGGNFQIGNTVDRFGHAISFTLRMQGPDARFAMSSQAFLGLNVGIVDKRSNIPNKWLVDTLFNVSDSSITIELIDGLIQAQHIFSGEDERAQLIAIGGTSQGSPRFNLLFGGDVEQLETSANICGGSNMVYIQQEADGIDPLLGALQPIVTDQDGTIVVGQDENGDDIIHPRMLAGMLASSLLQNNVDLNSVDAETLFNELKTAEGTDELTRSTGLANAGTEVDGIPLPGSQIRAGYIDRGFIGRDNVSNFFTSITSDPVQLRQLVDETCAISVTIDTSVNPPGPVILASPIL